MRDPLAEPNTTPVQRSSDGYAIVVQAFTVNGDARSALFDRVADAAHAIDEDLFCAGMPLDELSPPFAPRADAREHLEHAAIHHEPVALTATQTEAINDLLWRLECTESEVTLRDAIRAMLPARPRLFRRSIQPGHRVWKYDTVLIAPRTGLHSGVTVVHGDGDWGIRLDGPKHHVHLINPSPAEILDAARLCGWDRGVS